MDDESGESMDPMEEVPLIQLGEAELAELNWSTATLCSVKPIPEYHYYTH